MSLLLVVLLVGRRFSFPAAAAEAAAAAAGSPRRDDVTVVAASPPSSSSVVAPLTLFVSVIFFMCYLGVNKTYNSTILYYPSIPVGFFSNDAALFFGGAGFV